MHFSLFTSRFATVVMIHLVIALLLGWLSVDRVYFVDHTSRLCGWSNGLLEQDFISLYFLVVALWDIAKDSE